MKAEDAPDIDVVSGRKAARPERTVSCRPRLPHEKGFHVSWDQIHRDSRALAWRLDKQGPDDGAWRAVVAITRGGMAPAMIVARELDIRTDRHDQRQVLRLAEAGRAEVLKAPDAGLMGDGTGILSSTTSSTPARRWSWSAGSTRRRISPRSTPSRRAGAMVDTFITEVSQDTWIFFPWDMALQYVRPYRGE